MIMAYYKCAFAKDEEARETTVKVLSGREGVDIDCTLTGLSFVTTFTTTIISIYNLA